ncbi:MAG: hypothetical protein GXY74_10040, partial [Phycisphaerae bacterium]|nr:hypothetical protein [Phycisphaerae bacterium]
KHLGSEADRTGLAVARQEKSILTPIDVRHAQDTIVEGNEIVEVDRR